MKVGFYYFTGSGNTRRVCEALAEELERLGNETKLYSIRKDAELPPPTEFDCVVIGYPVHAFNAPAPVLTFLRKLPKGVGKGKTAYLLRTSGEPVQLNHASGISPARRLKKKGFEVKGEFPYVMPYNIIFRHSDAMVARMWRDVQLAVPMDAQTIVNGGGKRYKIGAKYRLASFLLRIEHFGMPFVGVSFRAKKKLCVGCGLCAKVCPKGNIKMKKKSKRPKFGCHCVACMGCAFTCPKDAIRPSLLNSWRVNGDYTFAGTPATDEEVCDYCKKAYLRYFHDIEDGTRGA